MKNIISILILTAFLMATSCTKEQLALNKLEGKWRNVEINENGTVYNTAPFIGSYWVFPECSAKKDEYCTLDMLDNNGAFSESVQYRISKDVKQFLMQNNFTQKDDEFEILTLEKTRFVIKTTNGNNYVITTFDKE